MGVICWHDWRGIGWRFGVKGENWAGLPIIGVSISSFSSSEINEVGGMVGSCGAEVPDDDICSCCAAISCLMAL